MVNFGNMSELEIVEALADWEDMISSEEMLSDRFDSMMDEFIESSEECICNYGEDEIAVAEDFSNWADTLCSGGEIHTVQYESYEYVGKYS